MRKVLLIIISLLVSVTINAQEKTLKDNLVKQNSGNDKVDNIQATGDKVTIKDGSTILMEVTNEGDGGSIYLKPLPSDITTFDNKLYNVGTELYWSGDPLGTSRNVGWETSISTVRLNSISDKVGIGINSPSAKLHVHGDDGVLFEGNLNSGTIPKEGAGVRMMWYPKKAAFRSGSAFGTEWDDANIGYYSTAVGGNNTIASGEYSTAMGRHATASGDWSTAFGNFASASGTVSVAMGQSNATGFNSTALGASTASGSWSTAMGNNTNANSLISTALGHYNVGGGDPINWIETDPLFEIGNGQDDGNRSNALTVLKNGYVGLGTTDPKAGLELKSPLGYGSAISLNNTSGGLDWRLSSWTDGTFRLVKATGSTFSAIVVEPIKGKIGIGVEPPTATLHVSGEDGVLFEGTLGIGTIPKEGEGIRMMWYPKKAAFRAGYDYANMWNDVNIGDYSMALGYSTRATGHASTSLGFHTIANSYNSTAIGTYNIGGGTPDSWISTDPLFEIGNGELSRSNAITVLKNGNVGIGTGISLASNVRLTVEGNENDYALVKINQKGTKEYAGLSFQRTDAEKWFIGMDRTTDNLQFRNSGNTNHMTIKEDGNVGIGTTNPKSKLSILGLFEYDDNAAALSAGLVAGDLYRTGDLLKIVH